MTLPAIADRYLRFCRARCTEAARLIDMLRLSPLEDECARAMARRIEHVIADAGRDAESAKDWAAREWPSR